MQKKGGQVAKNQFLLIFTTVYLLARSRPRFRAIHRWSWHCGDANVGDAKTRSHPMLASEAKTLLGNSELKPVFWTSPPFLDFLLLINVVLNVKIPTYAKGQPLYFIFTFFRNIWLHWKLLDCLKINILLFMRFLHIFAY